MNSSRRRLLRKLPFPLLIACVVAPVAQGSSSIDQSHISQSNVGSVPDYVNSLGQTFTVGTTGRLTQIDLQLGRTVEAVGYVTVELRNSVNGVPGGTLLGAQLLDATTLPQINPGPNLPFTSLTGFDLPVTAGETYAIVVRRNAQQNHPYVYWCIGPPDYIGGISYVQRLDEPWHVNYGDQDYGFQTWVVPEPTTGFLLVSSILALVTSRRHRFTFSSSN